MKEGVTGWPRGETDFLHPHTDDKGRIRSESRRAFSSHAMYATGYLLSIYYAGGPWAFSDEGNKVSPLSEM